MKIQLLKKPLFICWLTAMICICLVVFKANAQVTIGSSTPPDDYSLLDLDATYSKLGLHLPRLTPDQRNDLTNSEKNITKGLLIYNTENQCIEYWNLIKWVSLCKGQAAISFEDGSGNPADPTEPAFPPTGADRGPYTPHDNPDCQEQSPAYTFTEMSGSEYLNVTVLNETTGEFLVTMDENLTVLSRTAILRITNNCTSEYKEFLFTQEGATGLCRSDLDAPNIASQNGTSLCGNGAVYLYLAPPITDGTGYVWSRNGQEIARNTTNYVATLPGTYRVYAGAIGCETPSSASIQVTAGTGGAPDPVKVIVGQNNGFVCSVSDETYIYSTPPASGTLTWYKNGEKTTQTGSPILGGVGTWFAVVETASCSSVPSNEITVMLDPEGGAKIPVPIFNINGSAAGGNVTVCANGTLLLDITNPQPDVTYTWYVNNDIKGSGQHYELAMAGISEDFVLQCRATGPSMCSSAGVSQISISLGDAPTRPALSSNTGNILCGYSATLSTTSSAAKYRWYKDYVLMAETNSPVNTYDISMLGTYTLQVISNEGCVSEMSLPLSITQESAYGSVSISPQSLTTVNKDNMRQFVAELTPEDATSTYTWTITNATPATATGKSVLVTFGTTGLATISVKATNACTPSGVTAMKTIDVDSGCDPTEFDPLGYSPASKTATIIGSASVSLSVTPKGNPGEYSYEWFKNGTAIPGATSRTYSVTTTGTATTDTYTCKITSKCDGTTTATSDAFSITSQPIPTTLGSGTLSGRAAFDIASSVNSDGPCGNISGRYRSDFTQTATNTQVYTFTKSTGTVQNVRYAIVDNEGVLQTSQSLYGVLESGAMSQASVPLTLLFKTNLNQSTATPNIVGRTYDNAALVTVNIIYNNGSQDVTVPLKVRIQDCSVCRAKISDTVYKSFMCFNLGVTDQSMDPFVLSSAHNGSVFEYGMARAATESDYNNTGIPGSAWGVSSGNSTGVSAGSTTRGSNDPCPTGWRVPNYNELEGLRTKNTLKAVSANGRNGAMLGDALLIPYAGYYTKSKNKSADNSEGWWWSSRASSGSKAYDLKVSGGGTSMNNSNRYSAEAVRCISEK